MRLRLVLLDIGTTSETGSIESLDGPAGAASEGIDPMAISVAAKAAAMFLRTTDMKRAPREFSAHCGPLR